MLETIFFTILIYLFLSRKKKPRKPRTIDGELKQLIQESSNTTAISSEIKCFLLESENEQLFVQNNRNDKISFRSNFSENILLLYRTSAAQ